MGEVASTATTHRPCLDRQSMAWHILLCQLLSPIPAYRQIKGTIITILGGDWPPGSPRVRIAPHSAVRVGVRMSAHTITFGQYTRNSVTAIKCANFAWAAQCIKHQFVNKLLFPGTSSVILRSISCWLLMVTSKAVRAVRASESTHKRENANFGIAHDCVWFVAWEQVPCHCDSRLYFNIN